MTSPIAAPFPSGLTDDFSSVALDAARWTEVNGGGITGGRLYVNASFAGGVVYSSVRSRLDTFANRTLVLRVMALPAGDANAQLWVMDNTPAGAVDRIGFEYVGAADRMDFVGQTGGYAPLGTTVSVAGWAALGHTYLRLQHLGTSIVWSTSADGVTWTTRRTLATGVPAWTTTADCRVSLEAFRNTAGTNDTLQVDNVNLLATTSTGPLPTSPPTPADALQKRTLDELARWRLWLQTNGAAGFVGEFGVVTKWGDYGDAAQHAQWNALADTYLGYLDYAHLHSAYWSSGREFDAGYPLGLHVGTSVGTALSVTHTTSATVAEHPSRQGVIRSVNLAGWEHGVTINGGGTPGPRGAQPTYVHTTADFAYLAAAGVDTVRLPVAWERLQPTLGAALDTTALATLDGMLVAAAAASIDVVIDLHNYGRYTQADGTVATIGGTITNELFSDFWTRFSTWVRADTPRSATVIGYGLMNEPHDLPGGALSWQTASQAALSAIRAGGDTRLVLVGGYSFSSLTDWRTHHPTGWITDSAAAFAYEGHHYFDTKTIGEDGYPAPRSGQYQQSDGAGGRQTMTYAVELAAATPVEQTPVVRGTFSTTASLVVANIVTGGDTQVGDLLLAFHACDWGTGAQMPAPGGTAGAWTELWAPTLSDLGANLPHLKAWHRRATTAGAQQVTASPSGDSDVALIVVVINGSTIPEGTGWLDGAAGAKGAANTTAHVAPAVPLVGNHDRVLTVAASGLNSSTATPIDYAPPNGFTELREIDSAAWVSMSVATAAFAAPGSSGTRTFASSVSRYFVSGAVALRGAPLANPILVDLAPVRTIATTRPVETLMTGKTLDLASVRARLAAQRPSIERAIDLAPGYSWVTVQPVSILREIDLGLGGAPVLPRVTLQRVEMTNLSLTPLRIRVGVLPGEAEIVSITPLTDRRDRPVAQTYVRPRKNLRYLAQEVLSRKWVSWDLGLREPELTWNINTANEITGKIDAREVADLGLDEWSHFIHCEENGEIRSSGILLPWAPGGPEITVTAAGVLRYPQGLSFQGNFALGNPVGQNIDPLDVVRYGWSHLQSYPDGRLGVQIAPTTSPVRIGEPERDVSFETAAGEDVAFTSGPYLLKWYENTDLGKEFDDLAKETPFDMREAPRWNAARDDVIQYVDLGYPRVGRDRSDLAFAHGENLIEALAPIEDDERYASEVIVLGKGEGTARVRGTVTTRVGRRVRRSTIVEVKNADTTSRAQALASDDLAGRHGLLEVDEVHLIGNHPNAPFGSFSAGDDVPVRMTVDGYGRVIIRHRITGFTYRPEVSDITVRTKRSDSFSYAAVEVSS